MIRFNYEIDFKLHNPKKIKTWIKSLIFSENKLVGEISYIFCNDKYLYLLNDFFLNHDTFTDIISFDYSSKKKIQGDIFISIDRVIENAHNFKTNCDDELKRVMVHGVLHLCGYKDKSNEEKIIMRKLENNQTRHYLDKIIECYK